VKNAPLFFRTLVLDFAETALGLVFALTLVIPGDVSEAKMQAVVVVSAVLAAAVSAARRAIPGFVAWAREQLAIPAAE
jgi:hypothetical protein